MRIQSTNLHQVQDLNSEYQNNSVGESKIDSKQPRISEAASERLKQFEDKFEDVSQEDNAEFQKRLHQAQEAFAAETSIERKFNDFYKYLISNIKA